MSTGTRRPSISRFPSVSFSKQSSVNSDGFFDDADGVDSARAHDRQEEAEKGSAIWSTTRRKLTLVSLCLVYFAATASFAILSPFFPSEVNNVIMTSVLNPVLSALNVPGYCKTFSKVLPITQNTITSNFHLVSIY